MRFTLRSKLIILSIVVVTIIMADVTYFFTIRQLRDRRAAFELQMRRIAENIATLNLLDQQNWADYQDYISRLMAFNEDIVYIAVFDNRNWLRAHALNADLVEIDQSQPLTRRSQAELVRRLDRGLISEESRDDFRVQKVSIQSGDRVLGSVHVGFSLIEINNEMQSRVTRNIIMAIFLIALYSIISTIMSRRLTRPLERLSQAMASISRGNFDQQVKVENRDEIGQLAQTFNAMVAGLRERDILEKLGRELSQSFQLEHLTSVIQNRLSQALGARQTRLFLHDKNDGGVFREFAAGNGTSLQAGHLKINGATRYHLENRRDGFFFQTAPKEVQACLLKARLKEHDIVIPMFVKEQLFGLLVFAMPTGVTNLDEKHLQFAAVLAGQAAMALENAILYDELREQERVKRELEIARDVQNKLLPDTMPVLPGFQFDGICRPAQEVGGDYFDFFPISENRLGIVIADVSGKGTSASFYMAEIKGMMSTLVPIYQSPKKLLEELNKRLFLSLDRKVFATMIYGVLDTTSRQFTFVRAGHDSLVHIGANGKCEFLTPAGIGLGLDAGQLFEESLQECVVRIEKGESLLLFTDGITESMNRYHELFGEERLLAVLQRNGAYDAKSMRQRVFAEINRFVGDAQQHDDLTLVVVYCER